MEVEGSNEIQDLDLSDRELVSRVRHVLKSVSSTEGNSDDYEKLIDTLKKTHHLTVDEVAFLVTTLKALTGATRDISCIDINRHDTLLNAIFDMNMWRYTEDVMYALADLIVSLIYSKGGLVDLCLDMLVRQFIPPGNFLLHKEKQVLNCVHSALKNITVLMPFVAPMILLEIIPHKMPKIYEKEASVKMYVKNMLRLEIGPIGEPLRERILAALMDRLMELDVLIGCDDKNDSSKGVFDMKLKDADEPAHYAVESEDRALAEKLDSLMVITCEHLKLCSDADRLIEIFELLLDSFKITVLPTYRSNFTQFVIFYACSLDPEYCGQSFGNMLVDIFEQDEYPSDKRVNAVAYLASYLSRARFLESSFIIDIFNRLIDWCYVYCQNHDGRGRAVNPEAHKVFHSACQAIMYVLCFRMRALLPHLKPQLLERIFQSPLDPLKVCLPSIVEEFCGQAKAAGLFGDPGLSNSLLESDLSKAYSGREILDMFFPFDPCQLKNCERFIRPSFIKWSDVIPPSIVDKEDEDMTNGEDMTNDEDNNNHVVDGIVDEEDEDMMNDEDNNNHGIADGEDKGMTNDKVLTNGEDNNNHVVDGIVDEEDEDMMNDEDNNNHGIVDGEDKGMTNDKVLTNGEDNNNHVVDGIDGNFSGDEDVMGRSDDQDLDDGFKNPLNKRSMTPSPRSTLEYSMAMATYGIRPSTSPESL